MIVRILLLTIALLAAPAWADTTIVIVRHGEKPEAGLGQLTCQGLNRALALPGVLLARYGKPTAIYATNPAIKKKDKGVPYAYIRPLATIEPLAIRLGMPVHIDWGMTEVDPLAAALLHGGDGLRVVAWEHHLAAVLARRLMTAAGGDPATVPDWANDDFDSIYVVRVSADGEGKRRAVFAKEAEGLNGQGESCPN
jgi:hypothetical protein